MADNSKQIAALEQILASGTDSYSVDGTTTKFRSRDELIKELNRLKATDDASQATGKTRRTLSRFDLSKAW